MTYFKQLETVLRTDRSNAIELHDRLYHTVKVCPEEKSLIKGVMTNLVFYVANWDHKRIHRDRVYPLFIEHIVDEKSEALLICVEKVTYGSFIKKEIKIWFPKSGIEGGEDIHSGSKISEIHVKGCFLKKLVKGEYEYEL